MQTNGFIGKFQEKLEKILLPISEKLGEQRHLAACYVNFDSANNHGWFCDIISATTS